MITQHARVVRRIAGYYHRRWPGVPAEDFEQAVYIGLLKASQAFNPDRGVKFLSFANGHIKHSVREELGKRPDAMTEFDDQVRTEPTQETAGEVVLALKAVTRLTPQQQTVVKLRVMEGKTLVEVGKHLGVTHQRVSQIESEALEELRRRLAA
jgi:RNA polymerase sigma factor (sigma-70 family)